MILGAKFKLFGRATLPIPSAKWNSATDNINRTSYGKRIPYLLGSGGCNCVAWRVFPVYKNVNKQLFVYTSGQLVRVYCWQSNQIEGSIVVDWGKNFEHLFLQNICCCCSCNVDLQVVVHIQKELRLILLSLSAGSSRYVVVGISR